MPAALGGSSLLNHCSIFRADSLQLFERQGINACRFFAPLGSQWGLFSSSAGTTPPSLINSLSSLSGDATGGGGAIAVSGRRRWKRRCHRILGPTSLEAATPSLCGADAAESGGAIVFWSRRR